MQKKGKESPGSWWWSAASKEGLEKQSPGNWNVRGQRLEKCGGFPLLLFLKGTFVEGIFLKAALFYPHRTLEGGYY